LEEQAAKVGNKVRYRFDISSANPDPEKYNGDLVYPHIWTLPQRKFKILDRDKKWKDIAIVKGKDEKGIPNKFGKIQVRGSGLGYLELNMSDPDHQDIFAILELHPRNKDGFFKDPNKPGKFVRIDELANAKNNRKERSARVDAMFLAANYSDQEVRDFASAMNWDESDPIEILRDRAEVLAEKDSPTFLNAINDGKTADKALIKRALNKGILSFDPLENKISWTESREVICVLERIDSEGHNEVYRMAEWLVLHKNGEKVRQILQKMIK
jgi:hypothetical protein